MDWNYHTKQAILWHEKRIEELLLEGGKRMRRLVRKNQTAIRRLQANMD